MTNILLEGMSIGLPTGNPFEFDSTKPCSYCKLCGWVYQDYNTRIAVTPYEVAQAEEGRRNKANSHYMLAHSEAQRKAYEGSGLFLYPEAAYKLASKGIISITDLVNNEETRRAYAESSPIPLDKDFA